MSTLSPSESANAARTAGGPPVYWRVEGSLLELSALRQVDFFTWNAQSFAERWRRRVGMRFMHILRPVAYLAGRTRATRLLYTLLRGITRDRLDLLGEEYFEYFFEAAASEASSRCPASCAGRRPADRACRPIAGSRLAAARTAPWRRPLCRESHGIPRRRSHRAPAV